ncbi:MAG: choice-of-anchor D domain-containing protein [Candidatus Electryoneaceae bacterium]|nr:choice-of-anchor D domain-containing protein [Candidatus Electryoneaceae bacterium]
MNLLFSTFLIIITLIGTSYCAIIDVPGDFDDIQTAVDSSANGDTVLVQPGVYLETINYNGRNITVGSLFLTTGNTAYIDSTIIDGNRNGSVVRFDSGETNEAVLTGFTILNGTGSIDAENDISGGGVHCHDASPSLSYLKVTGNSAWYAAGIYCELDADAIISYCTITDNTASIAGGGMDFYDADPTIRNCTISGNEALRGGGVYCYYDVEATFENTIFWNNSPQEVLFSFSGVSCTISVSYSDIHGGEGGIYTSGNGDVEWGDGNIDLDPQFVDADNGDFRLTEQSPCIDAGNPEGELDPDNTWADMGSIYFEHERIDQPRILVNVPTLNFGVIEIGDSLRQNWFIRNTGYARLTITDIVPSGDHAGDFSVDFEEAVDVEPGAEHDMIMTFEPEAEGDRSAELTIESNDPNRREVRITLFGRGISRGDRHLWSVPDDFERIQDAIEFCIEGDTVLVQRGIYHENIDLDGKNILVATQFLFERNIDHISGTVLVGDRSCGVVSFVNGENENATLIGFTITNGKDGIYISSSSPTINHCVIYGNEAVNTTGGGIYCRDDARPIINNCTITGNSARWGGGIYCLNNTDLTLRNAILMNNPPNEVYFSSSRGSNEIAVSYSDVEGGQQGIVTNNNGSVTWGVGNINSDPLFLNPDSSDYRLTWLNFPEEDETLSPCIDTGDPNSPFDPDSTRADMGALYFNQNIHPDILTEPETIIFNDVQTGTSESQTVIISNVGVLPLQVTSQSIIQIEGPVVGLFIIRP